MHTHLIVEMCICSGWKSHIFTALSCLIFDLCPGLHSVSSSLRADEVIGIDLGTTNSCVAVMEGKVRLITVIIYLNTAQSDHSHALINVQSQPTADFWGVGSLAPRVCPCHSFLRDIGILAAYDNLTTNRNPSRTVFVCRDTYHVT